MTPTTTAAPKDLQRDYLLRAAIVAGIACAAWYIAIRPLEDALAQSRGLLGDSTRRLAIHQASIADEPNLDAFESELTATAKSLSEFTAASADAGVLYESFRALARRTGVRLERVEPRGVAPIPTARNTRSPGEVLAYSLELSGTYEEIAAFLAECTSTLGASKVASFRLAPLNRRNASGQPLLSAAVDTTHIRLDVPDRPTNAAPAQPRKSRS